MNITINTKYNIGDIVYIAWCYNGEFLPENKLYTINKIYAYAENENIKISYGIIDNSDDMEMEVYECDCFPTYAECTKWCKKQNEIS